MDLWKPRGVMIPVLFHVGLPRLINILQLTSRRCCSNCGGHGFALHYGRFTDTRSEKGGSIYTIKTGVVNIQEVT
jgi:hypothetical protein